MSNRFIISQTYRLFEAETNIEAPIIISGSISPIFGNAPSFRGIEYDRKTFEIIDILDVLDTSQQKSLVWQLLQFS